MQKEIGIILFLGINSLRDILRREIYPVMTILFGMGGLFWSVHQKGLSWELLAPVAAGAVLLAVSLLTKGAVGMGDALILLSVGMLMDWPDFLEMLSLGMAFCAACALTVLAVFRKEKNTELPFVPFLFLGYVGGLLL